MKHKFLVMLGIVALMASLRGAIPAGAMNGDRVDLPIAASLNDRLKNAPAPVQHNPLEAAITASPPVTVTTSSAEHPASPTAVQDTPRLMIGNAYSRMTLGGGFLYWSFDCLHSTEFNFDGYLRRTPAHGLGAPISTTLDYVPYVQCASANAPKNYFLVADNDGVYYYNPGSGRIERRSPSAPFTATPIYTPSVAPNANVGLVTDSTYIYWVGGVQGIVGTFVQRAPKGGGTGAGILAIDNFGPTSLVVDGNYLYWLDSTSLWKVDKSCTTLPCGTPTQLSAATGAYLLYQPYSILFATTFLYWANGNTIQAYSCTFLGSCGISTFYTAPTTDWKIGRLASDGSSLFWIENYPDCSSGLCFPSPNGKLQRKSLSSGTAQPIAENLPTYGEWTFADAYYVYYDGAGGILRLPANSAAISHDLAADKWEVVQAIQSPTNDVPLVAGKPTYVRAYGKQIAGSSRANTVEAYLSGSRNSSPLPGSPLKPINGNRSFNTGDIYDRGNLDAGWLFELPDSWTNSGTTDLVLTVDPRQLYFDPDRINNSFVSSFTFHHKAPVCIVTIPVRTHGPEASPSGNNFWLAVDMVKQLWPTSDVWAYHQDSDIAELQVCWWGPFPYPCYGAYELPDDTWKVLTSLTVRDTFSDDPDECDDAGARTHYIGIVHPSIDTGGTNGSGRMGYDQAWVKLPAVDSNPNDWTTLRGATLAHEMSHNYDRQHVDCPKGGPDDTDSSYPYPTCQLDNTGPNAHYGFVTTDQTVIAPDTARDFMAYDDKGASSSNRWVSDYNWKSMYGNINSLASVPAQAPTSAQPDLASAASVVMVSGAITPSLNQGSLDYAWVVPTVTLSAQVMGKWQALAAPAMDSSLMQPNSPLTPTYHLRLFDNNNVLLDDRTITLTEFNSHPDSPASPEELSPIKMFAATFPAPAGTVARLDLLADSTLLARLQPGLSTPTANIIQPAGGETFNNQMTIIWNTADTDSADRLLSQVQYSPDGGLTWRPIADNFPSTLDTQRVTLTLNSLSGFPGSGPGQGRIRVLVSDGYHTTIATSAGFTVNNHLPEPYIVSPVPNVLEEPGRAITLRGGASDAEDGGLSGSALQWKIDNVGVGTGTEVQVAGLAPGTYGITLTAQDSLAQMKTVTTPMAIGILTIRSGNEPTLDGYCDDTPYANAQQLQLGPYVDGAQATVRLVRTNTDLWVCFSGMNQKTGSSPYGLAGIGVDVDNSGGTFTQPNDYRFWVKDDGTPVTEHGNGSGGYVAGGPAGFQTYISADSSFWSAEMRIPASALGGWGHLARFNVFHEWARFVGDQNRWPYASVYNSPNTWATVFLGDWKKVYLPIVRR